MLWPRSSWITNFTIVLLLFPVVMLNGIENRSCIWTIGARKMYLIMLACAFTAFYVNNQFVYEMLSLLCSRALCKVMWLSSLIVLNDIIRISLLKCGITICLWTCIEWAFCELTEQQMCLFPVSVSLADACLMLSILLRLEVDRNSWCWIIGLIFNNAEAHLSHFSSEGDEAALKMLLLAKIPHLSFRWLLAIQIWKLWLCFKVYLDSFEVLCRQYL